MVRAEILTILFLIISSAVAENVDKKEDVGFFTGFENKLETKLGEYTNSITQWLARFNDKHLGGNSEIGRFLHYNELKQKIEEPGNQSRSMKKLVPLIPLIFHVGATSTWMILTTILAAKSVAIGMLLLIFKIAVSSAKISSFFTILKGKHLLAHAHHAHHDWTPHYEHHGHRRSLDIIDHQPTYVEPPSHPPHEEYSPFVPTQTSPEWSAPGPYKTLSSYKEASDPYTAYASESKQVTKTAEKKLGKK